MKDKIYNKLTKNKDIKMFLEFSLIINLLYLFYDIDNIDVINIFIIFIIIQLLLKYF